MSWFNPFSHVAPLTPEEQEIEDTWCSQPEREPDIKFTLPTGENVEGWKKDAWELDDEKKEIK